MRTITAMGAIALFALAAPHASAQTVPSQVRSVSDRVVATGGTPGIVTAWGAGNLNPTVVAVGRLSDDPDSAPVGVDSLWRVYSMTKPVTGIAAMILVEQGKLRLDQPISDFIPAFKNARVLVDPAKSLDTRPAAREITVRHLLTHTAGLGYTIVTRGPLLKEYERLGIVPFSFAAATEPQMRAARPASLEEFANRVASLPLISDPGSQFSYSISLDVLGRVIEVASGMKFDTFVNTKLFRPLGMTSSYWTVPASKANMLATAYSANGKGRTLADTGATSVWLQPPSFPYGGAGLVMSARDYDRFLRMLLAGGKLDGRRVLKPETVRLAMSNLLPPDAKAGMLGAVGGKAGFGAGGAVTLEDRPGGPGKGSFTWSGAAGTMAWVDPARQVRGTVMINILGVSPLKGVFLTNEMVTAVYADLENRRAR